MKSLTELLYLLTEIINPNSKPNGISAAELKKQIMNFGYSNKETLDSLAWLQNLNHIEYLHDKGRYKVKERHLVKTMGGELVVSGARGSEMIQQMKGLFPKQVIIEKITIGDYFEFERVEITEEYANEFTDFVGHIPKQETSLNIISDIKSQKQWVDELDWIEIDGLPFTKSDNGKIFCPVLMKNLTQDQTRQEFEKYFRKYPINLIEKETTSFRLLLLCRKTSEGKWETASIEANKLEEKRRAKFFVLREAGAFPFKWDNEKSTLKIPKFLKLPPNLSLALCCAGIRSVENNAERINYKLFDFEIYSDVNEDFIGQFGRCIWLED